MAQPPPPAQTPQGPLTRFQAQRKLGLFAPLDYTVISVILSVWLGLVLWKIFGAPDALHLVLFALVNIFLTQVWITVLVYRCLVFILDVQADINLMPEAAARIVFGFWENRGK